GRGRQLQGAVGCGVGGVHADEAVGGRLAQLGEPGLHAVVEVRVLAELGLVGGVGARVADPLRDHAVVRALVRVGGHEWSPFGSNAAWAATSAPSCRIRAVIPYLRSCM